MMTIIVTLKWLCRAVALVFTINAIASFIRYKEKSDIPYKVVFTLLAVVSIVLCVLYETWINGGAN